MHSSQQSLAAHAGAGPRRAPELMCAAVAGAAAVMLLVLAAQGGSAGIVVIGGGLLGLSGLAVLSAVPGLPQAALLFVMAVTLSMSIKFHPVFRSDHLGGAIGLRISITDIILALLVLAAVGGAIRRGWVRVRVDAALAVCAVAYLAWSIASTLASGDRALGWFQVSAVLQAVVLGLFLASRSWNERTKRVFVAGLLAALLLQSSVAMLQAARPGLVDLHFLGAGQYGEDTGEAVPAVDIGATTIAREAVYRPTGLLIHPNVLGAYFVLTLPLALVMMLTGRSRWEQTLAATAAAAAAIALYLSLSRSGWVGTAAALVIGGGLAYRWRALALTRTARACVAIIALAVAGAVAWKADRIYLRFTETASEAIDFRREYALTAWRMAIDHPVLGVGLNTFTDHAIAYDRSGISRIKTFPVHNAYLLELAETGFPGGLAFAAMAAAMVAAGVRAARASRRESRIIVLALTAGIAGFWVTQLSDYLYRIPIVTSLVWAHLGLALGLAHGEGSS